MSVTCKLNEYWLVTDDWHSKYDEFWLVTDVCH